MFILDSIFLSITITKRTASVHISLLKLTNTIAQVIDNNNSCMTLMKYRNE
jgi:hypothetical protein